MIIAALEVIHTDLGVVVIASVAEGVNGSDIAIRVVLGDGASAPCVIGVSGKGHAILVGDGNDVALQVFQEVVRYITIQNATDIFLVVIQRFEDSGVLNIILAQFLPSLRDDLGAVQRVGVLHAVDRLAGTNAVGVVGIGVAVKGLELPPLLSTLSSVYLLW